MTKNILIISTSPRKGGNSDTLADAFMAGAQAAGHTVNKISLVGKHIGFCHGCLACHKDHKCIMKDDAVTIVEQMKNADVVVFATPIYFYEMCGQMKTLLDRTVPLYGADYRFRDIYLIATSTDSDHSAVDHAIGGLQGWIDCFPGTELKGVVYGTGASEIGDAHNMPVYQEAIDMGQSV